MRRVESYAALAPLLSAQLRRGVVTNCFLSPADYQREIDAGLFYEEGDGFLLLLRQRAGYRLLNFYLHPGARLFLPETAVPLVTELACREKDQAAMRRAQDALCALGFAECFRRLRRTRAAVPAPNNAEAPTEASFEAVRAFLLEQFDPLTGCIPPDEELRQAIGAGQVLCLSDADGISGLLHYAPGRAQCEIRHLAVRADCRGHGYAGRLLRLLEAKTGGQKCAVWARVGNAPAEHFYEKNQFQPDGWQSVVLRLG
jgi:GNAT superfamily N-acetyltransferase